MDEQSLSFTPSTESTQFGNDKTSAKEDLRYFERMYFDLGHAVVVGVDEAGRGPIAGPVVAACAYLPKTFDSSEINDSKQLTEARRNSAFVRICAESIGYSIGIVDSDLIDQINILKATHLAMRRAIDSLPVKPDIILIDGLPVPKMADCEHRAIVRGDALSISIAAASIIAKVTRDRLMVEFARQYPQYGFERHKGYGSRYHIEALSAHGPCPIHRKSFAPVASLIEAALF